ncbi:site-specific integrase [Roseibium sp. RKSG952]|uniref:site-specific integrase n=1 Tax=Roseibium sp. RKSG952 TaxID=2529384 RepID=UPI0012BD30A0|nr:site-specific integrase [Roseibium sp. RKSG952]MTH95374.1 site-specific integrase [Roseibium sp. RKSG952]
MRGSYRSPEKQAATLIAKMTSLGSSRHGTLKPEGITSVGTLRSYQQSLTQFAVWRKEQGAIDNLKKASPEQIREYLQHRAEKVCQKTLDRDRQALSAVFRVSLERKDFKARQEIKPDALSVSSRAYTKAQVEAIAARQTTHHGLATLIAHAAGLRAHELHTLRPAAERGPSTHRDWSANLHAGRQGIPYTVEGKGGLVRTVLLPTELAKRLETYRLSAPKTVVDRGVRYQSYYAIPGGKAWSDRFSRMSSIVLGWSTGAHGVRHSYAQDRIEELQSRGFNYEVAKGLVAQEVGHFDANTTTAYLR